MKKNLNILKIETPTVTDGINNQKMTVVDRNNLLQPDSILEYVVKGVAGDRKFITKVVNPRWTPKLNGLVYDCENVAMLVSRLCKIHGSPDKSASDVSGGKNIVNTYKMRYVNDGLTSTISL